MRRPTCLRLRSALLALALAGCATRGVAPSSAEDRFVQDRFAIGFWVDPPADERMDERYAEIAAAHFTMVIGGFGARTPETVSRQLALCDKYDLRAVVSRAGLAAPELPDGPACWGYAVRDEPGTKDFPDLRA